ncbi:hypothetical protein FNV43_RR23147 [Rhamnella rubrinervis]|uniref:Zinc knuckle CX2CX4HX4C domain-containing protein n=1 Tax=Rhamnella rubrinervis TaxID=2594499 RepID=A0A8K0DRR7_9ROSA|nr:hypothetical protein FNV43_RR23147 [Rhamnella rubrinervis]
MQSRIGDLHCLDAQFIRYTKNDENLYSVLCIEEIYDGLAERLLPTAAMTSNPNLKGIGIPLRIDNSTIAGNYRRYARILVDVDVAGFVPEKLLLEMIANCIEVELYFKSFSDFCTSCHSVDHSVAKCKSVIGKVPPKNGPHANEKENKASDLSVDPSRTDFNTEIGKSSRTTLESDRILSHRSTVPRQVTSWTDAFGDSYDKLDDYGDDRVEDEWPPLQGKGSSKPSNEFNGTPYMG